MVREELDTLGRTIKYYRKKAGFTQEGFAEKVYLSRNAISDIENDKTMVTIDRLIDFAEVLGVHPARLIGFCNARFCDEKNAEINNVVTELEKLNDMELVGMVMKFVVMLQTSSFNKAV